MGENPINPVKKRTKLNLGCHLGAKVSLGFQRRDAKIVIPGSGMK